MKFKYDPVKLIEEVKIRPGLWDFDSYIYRSKNLRNQLWSEVVRVLLNGEQLNKSELRELELEIQKKWKSIRVSFFRYVKYPKLRNRIRPYVFTSKLTFLLKPDQQLPPPNEHNTSDVKALKLDLFGRNKYKQRLSSRRKKIKVKQECFGDDLAENDVNSNEDASDSNVNTTEEPENYDRLFLLSLLPHLNAVPEDNVLNAKMQLMQVLNAAQNHVPESNI